ncbi:MAG: DUF3000 domain-containing protein [Micrococcus sp.]|nr:DUF3000 domain-containing protein [Micrococcus sp.]
MNLAGTHSLRARSVQAETLPAAFRTALRELRDADTRPEVRLREIAAPGQLAPHAVALAADVYALDADVHASPLATGRFILLHHPEGSSLWQGTFRAVTYITAALEMDVAQDPMVGAVAWTWLVEALELRHADYSQAGGTATRNLAESFGTLAERPDTTEIEMRASWTPGAGDKGAHLQAWAEMVCAFAGLPPQPDGVTALRWPGETA